MHGLRHVVADDVFVFRPASATSVTANGSSPEGGPGAEVDQRYPYYRRWVHEVSEGREGPLARAMLVAAEALRGITVTIDGRCLGPTVTGTQLVTLGVIGALDRHTDLRLRVLAPDSLGEWAAAFLAQHPRVPVIRRDDIGRTPPTDVVHRPYQVASRDDLGLLTALGDRLVLTQLDSIALRNPGYFRDYDEWTEYRRLDRLALAAADQVVFISRDSANDALRLGLVDVDRVNVVYPATDLPALGLDDSVRPPEGAEGFSTRPFLLCLGTDFLHRNRVFAMRLLEALGQAGFDADFVFAGPKMALGCSAEEEAGFLRSRPELRERMRDLGHVEEPVKRWLLDRAAALVYPSTRERFGLTPFEAAEAGTPCLFASHTSLAEILPESAALLVPWDPQESAGLVMPVLAPGEARERHIEAIRSARAGFTSVRNARGLADVCAEAARSPSSVSIALPGADQAETDGLRRRLSGDLRRSVEPRPGWSRRGPSRRASAGRARRGHLGAAAQERHAPVPRRVRDAPRARPATEPMANLGLVDACWLRSSRLPRSPWGRLGRAHVASGCRSSL